MEVDLLYLAQNTEVTRCETSGEIRGKIRSETTGVTRGETHRITLRRFLHQGKNF
jgi:hypothetical protein